MKESTLILFLTATAVTLVDSRLVGKRSLEYKKKEYCEKVCNDSIGSCESKLKSIPFGASDCFCGCNSESGIRTAVTTTTAVEDSVTQIKDLSGFGVNLIEEWKKSHSLEKRKVAKDDDLKRDVEELLESVKAILTAEQSIFETYKNDMHRTLGESSGPKSVSLGSGSTLAGCVQDPNCNQVMGGLGPHIPPGTAELFDIPGTCQTQALDTIRTGEDVLQFQADRIRQRYAMSVFFCELDGGEWLEDDMWLSDLHECDWYNMVGLDACDRNEQMELFRKYQNMLSYQHDLLENFLKTVKEFNENN